MNHMKLLALAAFTVTLTASAKSFDLRTYNLAEPLEQWVTEATQAGTYDALPEIIKKSYAACKKGNYTVDSCQQFNEISTLVAEHYRPRAALATRSQLQK